jgi:hypothetical protein
MGLEKKKGEIEKQNGIDYLDETNVCTSLNGTSLCPERALETTQRFECRGVRRQFSEVLIVVCFFDRKLRL